MDGILKRNSTHSFQYGPFLSTADGSTPSTGLTISSAAVVVSKNGSSFVSKDDGNALTGTEDTRGYYLCRLNSTDLNTPGPLRVHSRIAGALPVWHNFEVVSSQAYNAMWSTAGTGYLEVNVVQIEGDTNIRSRFGILARGTAQNTDSTSITLASSHAFADDEINGAVVFISSGTGFGQSRMIVDYAGATDKAKVDAWVTTPSSICDYFVFAAPPASADSVPPVNLTQVAGVTVNTATAQLGVNVVSAAADAISADAVSAGAVTKISSGLATSTEVSTSFAAVTAALSTMAAAVGNVSTLTPSTATAAQIAAAVMASTVDGAYTLTQVQRGMAAVLLGVASGSSGSTTIFRDINDTKNRITAVTDTSGNRTAITLDLD